MRILLIMISLIAAVFALRPVEAQPANTDTCPALVGEALQQVGNVCDDLSRNSACYGYNQVTATFYDDVPATAFDTPADTIALTSLHTVQTSPLDEVRDIWGLALMNTRANLPNTAPGQNVVMLLMGDAQVENRVTPESASIDAITVEAPTLYAANLRNLPDLDGRVVDSVSENTVLMIDMQSADGAWLRVAREDGSIAWINREVIAESDEIAALPTPDALAPMQAFYFTGGIGQSRCSQASGTLYVQGPDRIQVDLQVNGAQISIGSTLAMRYIAPGVIEFATLSGTVYIDSVPVLAGYTLTAQVNADNTIDPTTFSGPFPMDDEQRAYYDFGDQIPANLFNYQVSVEEPIVFEDDDPADGDDTATVDDSSDDASDDDLDLSDVNTNPSLGGQPENNNPVPPTPIPDVGDDDDDTDDDGVEDEDDLPDDDEREEDEREPDEGDEPGEGDGEGEEPGEDDPNQQNPIFPDDEPIDDPIQQEPIEEDPAVP